MLESIFLNGLKEENQAELKLHDSKSFLELMDRALLSDEKNSALRKVGLMVEEWRGGKDMGSCMGKALGESYRGKMTTPGLDLEGKGTGEVKTLEGTSGEKKTMGGSRLTQVELQEWS